MDRPDFRQYNCKTILEPEQNDSVAPKPLVGPLSPSGKVTASVAAWKYRGAFFAGFPTKNTLLEEAFTFFLEGVYASFEKAWLATISAFSALMELPGIP